MLKTIRDLIIKRKSRIAILIDADNVPIESVASLLDQVSEHGVITIIRAYGNWSTHNKSWKSVLTKNGIVPIHLYVSVPGKNSADILMVIDAMDIMHYKQADSICLASSDSDFARLALRIRESGIDVIVASEKAKLSLALAGSCKKLIEIAAPKIKAAKKKVKIASVNDTSKSDYELIDEILTQVKQPDGWTFLGDVGNHLSIAKPGFNPKHNGFGSLTEMIQSKPDSYAINILPADSNETGVKYVYIKKIHTKTDTL